PIVTSDSIGCRNTIDDGKTGFMCKIKDVLSLTEAMEKIILMTPAQRQVMGDAGRRKMETEFDEQIIVKTYVNTLRKYKI
ncbi:MAG: glycosyltransferase family 1 protein, partial [Alistipes sp.]